MLPYFEGVEFKISFCADDKKVLFNCKEAPFVLKYEANLREVYGKGALRWRFYITVQEVKEIR